MKEIEEKLIEYKVRKNTCEYWVHECEKDLLCEEFDSYKQYHGCKLALQQNKEELEEIIEKINVLEKALEIIKGDE